MHNVKLMSNNLPTDKIANFIEVTCTPHSHTTVLLTYASYHALIETFMTCHSEKYNALQTKHLYI